MSPLPFEAYLISHFISIRSVAFAMWVRCKSFQFPKFARKFQDISGKMPWCKISCKTMLRGGNFRKFYIFPQIYENSRKFRLWKGGIFGNFPNMKISLFWEWQISCLASLESLHPSCRSVLIIQGSRFSWKLSVWFTERLLWLRSEL